MTEPVFPPLFDGLSAADADPLTLARDRAKEGCDAGLVTYALTHDQLNAAIVLTPEVALQDAVVMLPVCAVGFQNALGVLSPPEVGVHLGWTGEIYVNGGRCGQLRIAASHTNPKDEPDWLVIGLTLHLWPPSDDTGHTPDETALYAEGCAEVDPIRLLEAWVRHSLVGINGWSDDGTAAVHANWTGLAHGMGSTVTVGDQSGTFIGIDERMGLLLQTGEKTSLIPLTNLITDPT